MVGDLSIERSARRHISKHIAKTITNRERWLPLSVSVAVIPVICAFDVHIAETSGDGAEIILASAVTFAAIEAGFTSTAMSVLIVSDAPIVRQLKKSDKYRGDLKSYLATALGSAMALVLLSLLMLLLDAKGQELTAVWCSFVVLCIAYLTRLGVVMLRILNQTSSGRTD